jgi:hypothetical protein
VNVLHLLLVIWLLILNIKNKTWHHASQYIRSILHVIFFNSLYYFFCRDYLMWDFRSKVFKPITLRILHILLVNPLMLFLYLSKLPKKISQQVIHICRWITLSLLIEWIGQKKFKMIYFDHGWNIIWSLCIYVQMFILSLLVLKKPLITWSVSFVATGYLLFHFKVPVIKTLRKYIKDGKRLFLRNKRYGFLSVVFPLIIIIFFEFIRKKAIRNI